jgi:transcriptional regulator with XRE-family HTH domain
VTTRVEARQRVLAAMGRRGLTAEDVARLAGVVPRTVERFVRGHTFNPKTLDALETALGLTRKERNDKRRPLSPKNAHDPVVGWEQAARLLRIGVSTLRRHRREHGDETSRPWWGDVEELKRWYSNLTGAKR